jgi:pyruvate dehydrogenase E2 component (dihydrolipoamide acetyltransferase)
MAIQQPGRVRSLALIASAGLGPDIDNAYLDGFVTARSKREMKQVAAILFADPAAVTRSMIDDLLRYKRVDGVEALLAELRDGLFGGGSQSAVLVDGLAPLGKPVLVVWGADDRVIPAGHAQAAAGFADVHVLDGAGHMVQMERANDVNRLLAAHLS